VFKELGLEGSRLTNATESELQWFGDSLVLGMAPLVQYFGDGEADPCRPDDWKETMEQTSDWATPLTPHGSEAGIDFGKLQAGIDAE
jgi:hypothetical protein